MNIIVVFSSDGRLVSCSLDCKFKIWCVTDPQEVTEKIDLINATDNFNLGTIHNKKLVGWWKFDQTDGYITVDSSSNGNTGTLVGNPHLSMGHDNYRSEFDGIDDYVDCGNDPSLNLKDSVNRQNKGFS